MKGNKGYFGYNGTIFSSVGFVTHNQCKVMSLDAENGRLRGRLEPLSRSLHEFGKL